MRRRTTEDVTNDLLRERRAEGTLLLEELLLFPRKCQAFLASRAFEPPPFLFFMSFRPKGLVETPSVFISLTKETREERLFYLFD